MTTILLTNDDGPTSQGLWALHDVLEPMGQLLVITPDSPRSATGMSLTFHKPLRIARMRFRKRHAYVVSGNPADCVFLGVSQVLAGQLPDVVVSGINQGDNVTAQTVFASGTVAAAMQGAVIGVKSLAFSLAFPGDKRPSGRLTANKFEEEAKFAGKIITRILDEGLPRGVDYLNINFPFEIDSTTPVKMTRLGKRKYNDNVIERIDPSGRRYYWQWGAIRPDDEFEEGTDAHAVLVEKAISITPMQLDSSMDADESAFRI